MPFQFTPMNTETARAILGWKYDGPYAFYDYEQSAEHLLNEANWGNTLFAVLDENGTLVGELTLGFLDSEEEWVSQADMDAGRLEGCILWIGFGMRPDLTGRGLGLGFVQACVDFSARTARERYRYPGKEIGLGVYQFNQRAIKVYERAGFVTFKEVCRVKDGKEYPAQRMKKTIETPKENTIMNIKGIDAQRAEEMYRQIAAVKARVDQDGPAVLEAIDRRNQEHVAAEWKGIAEKQGKVSIESFVDVLWNQMCTTDGLEFEVAQEVSGEKIQMHCTYCPWYEIAKAAGATEVGYWLFCKTDPHMIAGFNQAAGPEDKQIKFSRTKTLMQGDDCCDHCYEYE